MEDFKFKKQFGQNFISDGNLLKAIVDDAEITDEDEVLEIGPGAGSLTKSLCERAKLVVSYEIDKELKPILEAKLADFTNSKVIFKDFMKTTTEEVVSNFTKKIKVVANIPYYITTPIIFKLLEGEYDIDSITIMIQKEVADRLVSKEGTQNYGAITAQINSIADVSLKRIVKRQMFMPMPNVDSAVVHIKINKNKYKIENLDLHRRVIEAAFKMRRKTLYNNLKSEFGFTPETFQKICSICNLDPNIRGEKLSPYEFTILSNAINTLV